MCQNRHCVCDEHIQYIGIPYFLRGKPGRWLTKKLVPKK